MICVDIGVFAHNEADQIGAVLDGLFDQDIFADQAHALRVHILANGCSDRTVAVANATITARGFQDIAQVHDLAEGGKSRTWNRFVHDLSRAEADFLVFMDADITIPRPESLRNLLGFMQQAPARIVGGSSRAVKDIIYDKTLASGPLDRMISAGADTLLNWKRAICGQLYVLRAGAARRFSMPIGLPVEDGFVRAMVQTETFTSIIPESRLDAPDDMFHVYASERGISGLIRHQTRIVIGSAVNQVIYTHLNTLSPQDRDAALRDSARDPDWLPRLLGQHLPARYGYVSSDFLTKRVQHWWRSSGRLKPKRIAVTAMGFAFDAIVYARAQYAMWRGAGAGHW